MAPANHRGFYFVYAAPSDYICEESFSTVRKSLPETWQRCRDTGTAAGMSSLSPRPNDRLAELNPLESKTSGVPPSWSGKCAST
jgi:hypothetical protein